MDHKKKKKTFEHIWQLEKGLVISSYLFLLPITNSINIKLNFQRIFDNPLSKFLSKEFLGCIGYISRYLSKLEYTQWATNLTPDLKIHISKPTDVLSWALDPTPPQNSF